MNMQQLVTDTIALAACGDATTLDSAMAQIAQREIDAGRMEMREMIPSLAAVKTEWAAKWDVVNKATWARLRASGRLRQCGHVGRN
jgi:hypothetical protein